MAFALPPLMLDYIIFVRPEIAMGSLIVLFLYSAKEMLNGSIGRLTIISNVFLLWQVFFGLWDALPLELQIYLNAGTLVAIFSFVYYFANHKLPGIFSKIFFVTYGSLSVMMVLLFLITGNIQLSPEIGQHFKPLHF